MAQHSNNVRFDDDKRHVVIRWFSSLCWGLLFFCILWDGMLIYYYAVEENPDVLTVLHVLAGVAVTYLTLALFFNRTSVSMNDIQLRVFHWPFPWIGNMVLTNANISQLRCVPGITITGVKGPYKTLANIKAVFSDGSECVLIRSLDKDDASLVQRHLERWLRANRRRVDQETAAVDKGLPDRTRHHDRAGRPRPGRDRG
jgi:hypothetical protein